MRFLSTAVKGNYYRNVQVSTYHQWVNDIYSEYRLGYVPKDGSDHDWAAVAAGLSGIGKKYAHVIIDEAQDFPIELLKILKKISDHMTCFIDPNQAIEVGKTDTYIAKMANRHLQVILEKNLRLLNVNREILMIRIRK